MEKFNQNFVVNSTNVAKGSMNKPTNKHTDGRTERQKLYIIMSKIHFAFSDVSIDINPYKPCILLMGHRQTVKTQIRHCRMQCLIRIFSVCKYGMFSKIWKKLKLPANTPKMRNGLILQKNVGKFIQLKWVISEG